MAIINCPKCNTRISDQLDYCNICNLPISENAKNDLNDYYHVYTYNNGDENYLRSFYFNDNDYQLFDRWEGDYIDVTALRYYSNKCTFLGYYILGKNIKNIEELYLIANREEKIRNVTTLKLEYCNIESFEGIELFVNLGNLELENSNWDYDMHLKQMENTIEQNKKRHLEENKKRQEQKLIEKRKAEVRQKEALIQIKKNKLKDILEVILIWGFVILMGIALYFIVKKTW